MRYKQVVRFVVIRLLFGLACVSALRAQDVTRFAYVSNTNATISTYTVNVKTGQLRDNGYALAGSFPLAVTVDPSGKFAYAVNAGSSSNSISAYTINSSTGALTSISSYSTRSNSDPRGVTIDPTGQFLYVANSSNNGTDGNILAFTINVSTRAPTAVNGSPFTGVDYPDAVAVDPSGRFAYVANNTSGTISAYGINAATGALSEISGSPFATGPNPTAVTVNPLGNYVYVPSLIGNYVEAYSPFTSWSLPSARSCTLGFMFSLLLVRTLSISSIGLWTPEN